MRNDLPKKVKGLKVHVRSLQYFDEESWKPYVADCYYVGRNNIDASKLAKLIEVHHTPGGVEVMGFPPLSDWAKEMGSGPDLLVKLQRYVDENQADLQAAYAHQQGRPR